MNGSIKARLEKLEATRPGRRPIYAWLNPGETQEQALARYRAENPGKDDPTMFFTWRMPDDDNAGRRMA
jgi:hypothetical protein